MGWDEHRFKSLRRFLCFVESDRPCLDGLWSSLGIVGTGLDNNVNKWFCVRGWGRVFVFFFFFFFLYIYSCFRRPIQNQTPLPWIISIFGKNWFLLDTKKWFVELLCCFSYFTYSFVYLPLHPTVSQFKRHNYQISGIARTDFFLWPMAQKLMIATRQPETTKGNIC